MIKKLLDFFRRMLYFCFYNKKIKKKLPCFFNFPLFENNVNPDAFSLIYFSFFCSLLISYLIYRKGCRCLNCPLLDWSYSKVSSENSLNGWANLYAFRSGFWFFWKFCCEVASSSSKGIFGI